MRSTTTTPTIARRRRATREAFLTRRARPIGPISSTCRCARRQTSQSGPAMQLYRRLDVRSARGFPRARHAPVPDTDQPCGETARRALRRRARSESDDSRRRAGTLADRRARQVRVRLERLAQQVMLAEVDFAAGTDRQSLDGQMGRLSGRAAGARTSSSRERKPSNPIVLTGDIHSNWVSDLKADTATPAPRRSAPSSSAHRSPRAAMDRPAAARRGVPARKSARPLLQRRSAATSPAR